MSAFTFAVLFDNLPKRMLWLNVPGGPLIGRDIALRIARRWRILPTSCTLGVFAFAFLPTARATGLLCG